MQEQSTEEPCRRRSCRSISDGVSSSIEREKRATDKFVISVTNDDGDQVVQQEYDKKNFYNNNEGDNNTDNNEHKANHRSLQFHEAAIYMEEGLDFEDPHCPWSPNFLLEGMLRHRKTLYRVDLLASILLLLLGFVEKPCLPSMEVDLSVHCSVEIVCLLVTLFSVVLKARWHWKNSLKQHKLDVIRSVVLVEMLIEAIVVFTRQQSHFRITRAVRPLFLCDNYYLRGVRRFLRLILKSMPPILDIIGLMMFIIIIYSIYGFYLLGPDSSDSGSPYFRTLTSSFINLFVLLTTANFPDIMMPFYAEDARYSLFFISYLVINLYFFMNLTLTVVYNTFTEIEDRTFKKMYMNKVKASQFAFNLLVTDNCEVSYEDFKYFMKIFDPLRSRIEVLLMFKYLDVEGSGGLNKKEFVSIYEVLSYNWIVAHSHRDSWYQGDKEFLVKFTKVTNSIVSHATFEYLIYLTIGLNGILMIVQAHMSHDEDVNDLSEMLGYIFISVYCLEAAMKLIGLGPRDYFDNPWNTFDFVLTLVGVIEALVEGITNVEISKIIWVRLLRFLRLLRIKKRFRDVFATAVILAPQLFSAAIVMTMIYYFFAIIGVELFSQYDLTNCCKNTSVEAYYAFYPGNKTTGEYGGLYYLNNFTSLPSSSVTLFELTVVNNWHIIMEGYAWKDGWSRIYFMLFYLLTLVVLTIVIASILEAFLFRIQYKIILNKEDEFQMMSAMVMVALDQLETESKPGTCQHWFLFQRYRWKPQGEHVLFTGTKRKTREELQTILYEDDIKVWLNDVLDEGSKDVVLEICAKNESVKMRKKRVLSGGSSRSGNNFHDSNSSIRGSFNSGKLSPTLSCQEATSNVEEIGRLVRKDSSEELFPIRNPSIRSYKLSPVLASTGRFKRMSPTRDF